MSLCEQIYTLSLCGFVILIACSGCHKPASRPIPAAEETDSAAGNLPVYGGHEISMLNGGFDEIVEGKLVNWKTQATPPPFDEEIKESGRASLRITAENTDCQMGPEIIPLQPKTSYEVRLMLRHTSGASMYKYFVLNEYNAAGKVQSKPITFLDWDVPPNDFIEVHGFFITRDDTVKGGLTIHFSRNSYCRTNETWWLDSLRLFKIADMPKGSAEGPELLKANPGFESGIESPGYPMINDPAMAHSGQRCLGFKQGGKLALQGVKVNHLSTYRFSIWAKGQGEITLRLYRYPMDRNGRMLDNIGSDELKVSVTPEWKQYFHDFTIEHPRIGSVVPNMTIQGNVYIDDASFRLAR